MAPPYLASGLLQTFTPTFFVLMCASLILHALGLDPHVFYDGGLIWYGDWLVRVGVGAPCLGGGLPSLLALHLRFWLIQHG